MIQILWRCDECNDYGTINLTPGRMLLPNLISGEVAHQNSTASFKPHHKIIILDKQYDTRKIENSGVQS